MSNSSKIEEYIHAHRDAFDTAVPDAQCWAGIQRTLDCLTTADRLEQYLLLNRPSFDQAEPPVAVWAQIEGAMESPPIVR
ncbi:MAG: hypothetical protein IPH12_22475 [Saprospirales bacterium]|nr:hypothetical protein [Saprospirales bacterium]